MSSPKNHIDKLTPEIMARYEQGLLSEEEQHQVEVLLLDSAFDREGAEGFAQYEGDIVHDLAKLNSQLERRIATEQNNRGFFWFKIAAGILLLALSTYLVYDITRSTNIEQIAASKAEKPDESLRKPVEETVKENKENVVPEDNPLELLAQETKPQQSVPKPEPTPQPNEEESVDLDTEPEMEAEVEAMPEEEVMDEVYILTEPESAAVPSVARAAKAAVADEMATGQVAGKRKKAESRKEAAALLPPTTIVGKVTSADDGTPLPGINILLKGTTTGTVTDVDGNFKLESEQIEENSVLVANFIGMATEEVVVGNKSEVNIALEEEVVQLSEVVVTAMGEQKNVEEVSYKSAQPSGGIMAYKQYLKELARQPADAKEAIKGKVVVKFYIEADGTLSDFEIKRSLGKWQDEEALRLIKEGPKWQPAESNGQSVKSSARVVVKFE